MRSIAASAQSASRPSSGARALCDAVSWSARSAPWRSDWAGPASSLFDTGLRRSEVKSDAPTEVAAPPPKKPVFVNPIIDLAGDPLIIRLGDASETNTKLREVAVTPELKQPALSDGVEVLSDVMLSSSQRIMALPSSPEDFAFFQSQSARGQPRVSVAPVEAEPVGRRSLWKTQSLRPVDPDSEEVLVPVAGQDDLDGDEGLAAPEEEPILEEDGIPTEGMTPSQPASR